MMFFGSYYYAMEQGRRHYSVVGPDIIAFLLNEDLISGLKTTIHVSVHIHILLLIVQY